MKTNIHKLTFFRVLKCILILSIISKTLRGYAGPEMLTSEVIPKKNEIPIIVYIPPEVEDMYREHGIDIVSKVLFVFKMVENGINKTLKEINSEKYYYLVPEIKIPDVDPRNKACPITVSQLSLFLSEVYNSEGGTLSFIYITLCQLPLIRKQTFTHRQKHFYITQSINGTHNTMTIIFSEVDTSALIKSLARAILKACDLHNIEPLSVRSPIDIAHGIPFGVDILKETVQELLLKEFVL
ncbi:hypothetical protein NEPAR06_1058 [Nematocida parisii]|uniref:Uncharacterized protein n=1 Tax=Nematocida parisii (strain ERTm3) TaxID=935791 RepID=I3EGG2_NEMP3|nr:uncharacterized protein NEPG_01197 [Nematocida parisii ERTm1]EIJ88309.1 hypothetical protein NEQG_01753 [Nematocida parisii ERTm3]KAI5125438.1 hypothetical protein NEPAR03_0113 [Nematocida parisii]EIJ93625.1 hypothetical protein NEPG_01197 [Nematocida parisii ERTm1]KAI5125562.1 hypothetical protein NEPAR08_0113 [Nematocida parisii]KAI5141817.1 hypothetical protein NEPAR04_1204 [Nematocida parisii]|eukprot:XP_013059025.1 hypothetical protein NEPG_01197 [Nematocida parisii ERTm1]